MRPGFTDDDWLDEVGALSRPRQSKKATLSRAKTLPREEGNATVTELFPNQSAALLDGTVRPVLCGYRMSTLAFGTVKRERSPVCVGDRVKVEIGVIVGRCERKNRLVRPAPNARDPLLHVLAANIDLLVVVAAAREPEFAAGIVDRFLVAASAQKIETVLAVNKADLIAPGEMRPWSHYPKAGVRVVEVCARTGSGIDRLASLLLRKAAVFCGHSGVGKTSILRRLMGDEAIGKVGLVSPASGKGRHTTTGAVMIAAADGASFIDTPGVTNFALLDVDRKGLLEHFPDLNAAAAKCAAACAHEEEPGCALRELPRFAGFCAIRRSLG